ncbi:unnamed protein product [uncultured virus]|nr:unnamed protein product [uncultured virus]
METDVDRCQGDRGYAVVAAVDRLDVWKRIDWLQGIQSVVVADQFE